MYVDQSGIQFIEDNEGKRYTAYLDTAGVLTNGVGHTGKDVFAGQVVDEVQVQKWLAADLLEAEAAINANVKVALAQQEFNALTSFVFNIGVGAFEGSTILRVLNSGKYELIHNLMLQWNHISVGGKLVVDPGLSNRRLKEATLFDDGIVHPAVAALPSSGTVPVAPLDQHATYTSSPTIKMQIGSVLAGIGAMFSNSIGSFFSHLGDIGDAASSTASNVSGLVAYGDKFKYMFIGLTMLAAVATFGERIYKMRHGK